MPDHLKIYEAHCPHCGKLHTSAENADDGQRAPRPGDPSVCNRCARIVMFSPEMQLVPVPPETLEEWMKDDELSFVIAHAIATVKTRKHYDPFAG